MSFKLGSFLVVEKDNSMSFVNMFKMYLEHKRKTLLVKTDIRDCYDAAGKYYEEKKNTVLSLKYYQEAKNYCKICEILESNSKKHPGQAFFTELEEYYANLPIEITEQSPAIMSGLSMLYSLSARVAESEYWANKVECMYKNLSKKSPKYKDAQEAVAYLAIALPHRGVKSIKENILAITKMGINNLREFSVTGNMPSVMNGGKDFSSWSKNDTFLYNVLKIPAEFVLGKRFSGFADIALAESKYEKSPTENFLEVLLLLNNGLTDIQQKGTMEMFFAANAILSRLFMSKGDINGAEKCISAVLEKSKGENQNFLTPNVEAFNIRHNLMLGHTEKIEDWVENEAPDETKEFHILQRYRYMTKIMGYIVLKRYTEAISLSIKMKKYYVDYQRPMGEMEANVLASIVYYRTGNSRWELLLTEAVDFYREHHFIRPLAEMGTAVFEQLLILQPKYEQDNFFEMLLTETKKQAALYPNYLSNIKTMISPLTETEKTVLSLIVKGKSNGEISSILHIAISTVKFHVSNIYGKMGVRNRISAIDMAEKLNIL